MTGLPRNSRRSRSSAVPPWADPIGEAMPYPLRVRLADAHQGRRDARKRIPLVSVSADSHQPGTDGLLGEDATSPGPVGVEPPAVRAQQAGADGAAKAAWLEERAGTAHLLMLRALARERIVAEREVLLREIDPIEAELGPLRAQLIDLDDRLAAAERRLEELVSRPPSDEDLKERRMAEADLSERPDRLVRERRLAEYRKVRGEAEETVLAIAADRARVVQQIRSREQRIARREAIARARANRIFEHAWRRVATYWQQLIRAHQHGPELNAILRPVGPELPAWARELEDHRGPGPAGQPDGTRDTPSSASSGESTGSPAANADG